LFQIHKFFALRAFHLRSQGESFGSSLPEKTLCISLWLKRTFSCNTKFKIMIIRNTARLLQVTIALLLHLTVQAQKPNVIIIFMDDMGYGDPVCYGGGPYQTPQMDALAAQGMRFTNFYVAQAVCSASRSALLTGCYPTRIGISGALFPYSTMALNPEEQTLPELLQGAGYKTGMMGKWHLGQKEPFLPLQHGFNEYLGIPYSNDMWPVNFDGTPQRDTSTNKGKYHPLPLIEGNKTIRTINTLEDQGQLTQTFTERAVRFIGQNKSHPFFLYLAHPMVHVPIAASEHFRGKSGAGLYGDVMEEVDWSVGEVIKALKANGVYQNTIVIFTSDNGPWLTFGDHAGNTAGLREGKGSHWEGGLKVACMIAWPGKVPAGKVCNGLMTTMDLLPTLAKLCGAPLPSKKIDGLDCSALLLAKTTLSPRTEFAYYYDRNNLKAIRDREWKLVFACVSQTYNKPGAVGFGGFPGRHETDSVPLALYNLHQDPGEERDLKDKFPEVVQRLSAAAERYRSELGDGLTKREGAEVRPAAKVQ